MRMSNLFSQTLRDAPADSDIVSHQLLVRGGFVRQLGAGIYTMMPLGQRVKQKVSDIIREEMNAIGGQEISMPVVHPAEIWKETGRWYEIGSELTRFEDRSGRDMVLAMTHEEVVTDITRREVNSYRQLPMLVYQLQTKWRDEPRARGGLIRVREFIMKDSYSLDKDFEGLEKQYRAHYQAYFNMYNRMALPAISVASDTGMMGGKLAHEYMYLTPIGEDTLLICQESGYRANREVATFQKPTPEPSELLPLERVETPNTTTIASLAQFLGLPESQTAKAVFYMGTFIDGEGKEERQQLVFAIIRGDMELNELKLANAIHSKTLRPATEAEIEAVGAAPGYASPIGIEGVLVVVDDLIPTSPNLVAGANEAGYHYKNVNYERDYSADVVADIVAARAGDPCPVSGHPLEEARGVEIGNIFQLGTRYTAAMNATYLDENGKPQPVVMGSYGIGVGRALACIAEEHHDDNGLIWPMSVAPFQVHIVLLSGGEADDLAEQLYTDLQTAGVEVLFDDRPRERAGVKFKDADLIGVPLRLTVSERALSNGGVEYKRRDQDERDIVPSSDVVAKVKSDIQTMMDAINKRVVEVEYEA